MKVEELLNRIVIEEYWDTSERFDQICDLLSFKVVLGEDSWPTYTDYLNHLFLLPKFEECGVEHRSGGSGLPCTCGLIPIDSNG